MKKILIASTALVMFAGAASADVAWSGFGRFGIVYDDAAGTDITYLEQRFQLDVVGTTETDNGLTVGGRYRLRSEEQKAGNDAGAPGYVRQTAAGTVNAAQMFIQSGGLELSVGNVDYALDSMANLAVGNIGLQNFTSFLDGPGYASRGASPTGLALTYAMGGLNAHLSYDTEAQATDAYVSYDFAGYTFGVGGQDSDAYTTDWVVAVGGTVGTAKFNASYVNDGTNGTGGVGGGYAVAAHFDVASGLTVGGYLTYFDSDTAGVDSATGLGVDASYALGGGVNLVGGVYGTDDDKTEADFGINFRF